MRKKVNKIEEVVGETLYNELHLYPKLKEECDILFVLALEYEKAVLSKQPAEHLKSPILNKILSIHNIALEIEKYRVSNIFFNENLGIIKDISKINNMRKQI